MILIQFHLLLKNVIITCAPAVPELLFLNFYLFFLDFFLVFFFFFTFPRPIPFVLVVPKVQQPNYIAGGARERMKRALPSRVAEIPADGFYYHYPH